MVRLMTSTPLDPEAMIADLEALTASTTCLAAVAIGSLPEQVQEVVNGVLWNRPDVSTAKLAKVLEKHGAYVKVENLARHRRRTGYCCKCDGKPPVADGGAK